MIETIVYESENIPEIFIADSFWQRLLGYMFRKAPHYEAILFKPCNSIHTFFMRFSIDVLFLNEQMEVIKKIENLPPGKVIMPQKNTSVVIEGRAGRFKNIEEGSKVSIIF